MGIPRKTNPAAKGGRTEWLLARLPSVLDVYDNHIVTWEPLVSIITPTYNHADFLPDCIGSVLGQTFPSWELVVIDDGSTDDTSQVVDRFRDQRIRYVRQEHRGVERLAETYNDALALCRAPLITILEGDDYWPADKLESLVPAFQDEGVVLAYGVTEVVGEGRSQFASTIPSPDFANHFPSGALTNTPVGSAALAMLDCRGLTFTYPCSVILRRLALERIGGFQERSGLPITDYPTFLRLSLDGRFHFEERTMGYWRVHRRGPRRQGWIGFLTRCTWRSCAFATSLACAWACRMPCGVPSIGGGTW